jgi:hypothetical protein
MPTETAAPRQNVRVAQAPSGNRGTGYALAVLGTISLDAGPAPVALFPVGGKALAEFRTPSIWQPSIGVAFQFAQSGFIGRASSAAEFEWLVVRTSFCPLGPEIVARGRLRACVLADFGSMSAKGRSEAINVPEGTSRFWLATGPGLALALRPVPPLFIELGGGVLAAWTQPVYIFAEPRTVVHEVPPVAWTGHIGLGVNIFDQ